MYCLLCGLGFQGDATGGCQCREPQPVLESDYLAPRDADDSDEGE